MAPETVPQLLVGATGPKTLALSGELAQGTVLSGGTTPDACVGRSLTSGRRITRSSSTSSVLSVPAVVSAPLPRPQRPVASRRRMRLPWATRPKSRQQHGDGLQQVQPPWYSNRLLTSRMSASSFALSRRRFNPWWRSSEGYSGQNRVDVGSAHVAMCHEPNLPGNGDRADIDSGELSNGDRRIGCRGQNDVGGRFVDGPTAFTKPRREALRVVVIVGEASL